MLILPYVIEIPLVKGMGVSMVEIDVTKRSVFGIYEMTYNGLLTSMNTNEYTYVNETQFNQKVYKGAKNLYIA